MQKIRRNSLTFKFYKTVNHFLYLKMKFFLERAENISSEQSIYNVCFAHVYRHRTLHKARILEVFCVV